MMNQEGIFKKVGQILNELQDQYDFLARNPGQLNDLELELFLANANFLSDHVQIVRKFNSHKLVKEIPEHTEDQSAVVIAVQEQAPEILSVSSEVEVAPEEFEMNGNEEGLKMEKGKTLEELESEYAAANEPDAVEEEAIDESPAEPLKFEFLVENEVKADKFEFEVQPVETIYDRPLSKEEEEIIAEKQRLRDRQDQQVNEQDEEEVVVPFSKEPEVMQARPTLNDLLASKSHLSNSLNEESSNRVKITDLKQAINLNQKLLYIKDLFNGYNLAYAEAIELINKMPDFKTADSFLQQNYAAKNNWSSKQSTVDQFYELLNQRFAVK